MIMIISSALLVCSFRACWRPSLLVEKMSEAAIEASVFFFFERQPLKVTYSKLPTEPERIERSSFSSGSPHEFESTKSSSQCHGPDAASRSSAELAC